MAVVPKFLAALTPPKKACVLFTAAKGPGANSGAEGADMMASGAGPAPAVDFAATTCHPDTPS
jgi:hypothetical protein